MPPTPPRSSSISIRRHPHRAFDRRRRGDPLRRPPRQWPCRQAGADRRRAAGHGQDAGQSGRPADRSVRRLPAAARRQPRTVLSRYREQPLLQLQPSGREAATSAQSWPRSGSSRLRASPTPSSGRPSSSSSSARSSPRALTARSFACRMPAWLRRSQAQPTRGLVEVLPIARWLRCSSAGRAPQFARWCRGLHLDVAGGDGVGDRFERQTFRIAT